MMEDNLQDPQRWRTVVIVQMTVAVFIAAMLGGLAVNASINAARANGEAQWYSIQVSGELDRAGLRSGYEAAALAYSARDLNEAIKLQWLALALTRQGKHAESAVLLTQSGAALARYENAQSYSIVYSDLQNSNKPDSARSMTYVEYLYAKAQSLRAMQFAAVESMQRWTAKAESYTAVFSLLAMVLFVLGVAQAVRPPIRLLLAIFGALFMIGAMLLAVLIALV